ncbi:MAG TPA: cupin domain-containing protein [Solirubrobacteraceae bacterium]|jgi:quercetin dioxygenase-like cupin family protein
MSLDTATASRALHRPAGTGEHFSGPGDVYRFLATGEETGGAYFVMEAIVPPGGGPPPHIHGHEDETFYVVEGRCTIRLGDEVVTAATGDYVHVPRGVVHNFHNDGDEPMRMILTFTPAGIEHFFEETLERGATPGDVEPIARRYADAAPRYGMTFLV